MAAMAALASINLSEAKAYVPNTLKYQEVMEKLPPKEERLREGLVRRLARAC